MKKYVINENGYITGYIDRYINIEAESQQEALDKLSKYGKWAFNYSENVDTDDDYIEFNIIKEVDSFEDEEVVDPKEKITISKKEYKQLLEDQILLNKLKAAGVDNWEDYHEIDND